MTKRLAKEQRKLDDAAKKMARKQTAAAAAAASGVTQEKPKQEGPLRFTPRDWVKIGSGPDGEEEEGVKVEGGDDVKGSREVSLFSWNVSWARVGFRCGEEEIGDGHLFCRCCL